MQAGASFLVETFEAGSAELAANADDGWPIAIVRTGGEFAFFGPEHEIQPTAGDLIVRLYRPALITQAETKQHRWNRVFRRRSSTGSDGQVSSASIG